VAHKRVKDRVVRLLLPGAPFLGGSISGRQNQNPIRALSLAAATALPRGVSMRQ
jgi:hypothetical protein